MSDPNKLDAFELDRLDLFSTTLVLKYLIRHVLKAEPDPHEVGREIVEMLQVAVGSFEFYGVEEGAKTEVARDYMVDHATKIITQALAALPQ